MRSILIESLKDFERKKATVETALARIEMYKKAIENPRLYTNIHRDSQLELGSIKGKGGKPSSSVESEVIKNESDEMMVVENLREWIKEDISRIHPIQAEVEQVDVALNALTEQQRYIIKCKYFNKMFWKDIENEYNKTFKEYITERSLKNKNRESLEELCEILKPYYERRYTVKH